MLKILKLTFVPFSSFLLFIRSSLSLFFHFFFHFFQHHSSPHPTPAIHHSPPHPTPAIHHAAPKKPLFNLQTHFGTLFSLSSSSLSLLLNSSISKLSFSFILHKLIYIINGWMGRKKKKLITTKISKTRGNMKARDERDIYRGKMGCLGVW